MAGTSMVPLALTGPALAITIALGACTRGGTGAPAAPTTTVHTVHTTVRTTVRTTVHTTVHPTVHTAVAPVTQPCGPVESTGHPVADHLLAARALLLGAAPSGLTPALQTEVDDLADDLAALAHQARAAPPADLPAIVRAAGARLAAADATLGDAVGWLPISC